MKKSITITLCVMALLWVSLYTPPAYADRGMMPMRPVSMKENVDVYDTGQKAIICWNRGEEILILSTDKYASHNTKILEFLPLPSKPSVVEKADPAVFKGVAKIIAMHRPKMHLGYKRRDGMRSKGANSAMRPESAVEIVFHKKIGAHDISIGHVRRMDGFEEWAMKFFKKHGMQYRKADVAKITPVVQSYLNRGYKYFVFDVVELTTEKKTIAPIFYRFKTPRVYFPLKVTTLSKGETNIGLYLFTPFKTDIWGTRTGFVSGFYGFGGRASYKHPIKFTVSHMERKLVSNKIYNFFKSTTRKIWFSTAKYKGPTTALKRDFIMYPRYAEKESGVTSAKNND